MIYTTFKRDLPLIFKHRHMHECLIINGGMSGDVYSSTEECREKFIFNHVSIYVQYQWLRKIANQTLSVKRRNGKHSFAEMNDLHYFLTGNTRQ